MHACFIYIETQAKTRYKNTSRKNDKQNFAAKKTTALTKWRGKIYNTEGESWRKGQLHLYTVANCIMNQKEYYKWKEMTLMNYDDCD